MKDFVKNVLTGGCQPFGSALCVYSLITCLANPLSQKLGPSLLETCRFKSKTKNLQRFHGISVCSSDHFIVAQNLMWSVAHCWPWRILVLPGKLPQNPSSILVSSSAASAKKCRQAVLGLLDRQQMTVIPCSLRRTYFSIWHSALMDLWTTIAGLSQLETRRAKNIATDAALAVEFASWSIIIVHYHLRGT